MKNLKEKIPLALEAIKKHLIKDAQKNEIEREYNGYVSSLGAGIIQSGLIPTLSFYSDTAKNTSKLLKAILYVLNREAADATLLNYTLKAIDPECKPEDSSYRFSSFKYDREKESRIKQQILEASVAIKLAMRSFKQSKS